VGLREGSLHVGSLLERAFVLSLLPRPAEHAVENLDAGTQRDPTVLEAINRLSRTSA
jgi:hypothetical protein